MMASEIRWALLICAVLAGAPIVAAQAPVVEGMVTNAVTGEPLRGARIKLWALEQPELYTRTDTKGHFEFSGLNPKLVYSLDAQQPGFLGLQETQVLVAVDLRWPGSRGIVTPPRTGHAPTLSRSTDPDGSERAILNVPLMPYAVITGKITDPNGVPLVFANVELRQGRTTAVFERTDDRGQFRMVVRQAGTYYLAATGAAEPMAWDATYRNTFYPRSLDVASARPLEIAPGQQLTADIQIVRQSGVPITGTLTGPGGTAIPLPPEIYASLALLPVDEPSMFATGPFTAAVNNAFEFKEVLPGRYTLLALARQPNPDGLSGGTPVWGAMQTIEVGFDGLNGVAVELQSLPSISGQVTFARGCSPAPVRISAYARNSLAVGGMENTSSGADGSFTLSGLTPGHVVLNIRPQQDLRPVAARLGDRDVLASGFDYPAGARETLRIEMDCAAPRRTR